MFPLVDLCAIDQQLCEDENSLLSFEAIRSIHKLMDDDADGTVDATETDEVRHEAPKASRVHAGSESNCELLSVSQGGSEGSQPQSQTQQLPPSRRPHQRGGHVERLEGLRRWV